MAKSHKLNGKKASPDEYAVGYGRPPKTHQFKPGQSGNSKGRPKGQPSLQDSLLREMARMVGIKTQDGVIRVTKQEALIRKLLHSALEGDVSAMRFVFQIRAAAEAHLLNEDPTSSDSSNFDVAADEEMMRRMLSRFEHLRDEEG